MADSDYRIVVNFSKIGEDGYQSPYSVDQPSQPSCGREVASGANLIADLRAFSKAVPGASLVKQTFDWQISLIGRYSGSQDAQQKANAAMTIAGQIGGVVGAFALGGPIAGLLSVGAVALSYAKEIDQNRYERNWENIGLMLARERAGPSLNRSRV